MSKRCVSENVIRTVRSLAESVGFDLSDIYRSTKDAITRGYFEAMVFTDFGGDSDIPDEAKFSQELVDSSRADLKEFERLLDDLGLVDRVIESNMPLDHVGNDFWLTRNHHGAGFWDGDYPEDLEKAFMGIVKNFGEVNLYVGDDGLVYL